MKKFPFPRYYSFRRDQQTAGYCRLQTDDHGTPEILVPFQVAESIEADQDLYTQQMRLEREAAKAEAARTSRSEPAQPRQPGKLPFGSAPSRAATPTKFLGADALDLDKEAAAIRHPRLGEDYDLLTTMPVFAADEPLEMMRRLYTSSMDRDKAERQRRLYDRIKSLGSIRSLGAPAGLDALDDLGKRFPHFSGVLDVIRCQFLLAKKTNTAIAIPPLLLLGPPGIGKTEFSQQLANTFGSPMKRLAFDNDQTGAALLGSDKKWGNSEHGMLFEQLVLGTHANPVILLDEVDKAAQYRGSDPLASLHTLLESSTNANVRDISLEFTFDASHVIWIATANHPEGVADTIRSRFTQFCISPPSGQQAIQMARMLAHKVQQDLKLQDFAPPSELLVARMAPLSAREQIRAWQTACAKAIADDRNSVLMTDLPERVVAKWLLHTKPGPDPQRPQPPKQPPNNGSPA